VKTNMMAILLVAAQKGFWNTDEATLQQLAQRWADLLLQHGLPGSGHTRPDHPVFQWVMSKLREDQRAPLQQLLDKALVDVAKPASGPATMTELQAPEGRSQANELHESTSATAGARPWLPWSLLGALVVALMAAGYARSRNDFSRQSLEDAA
jgi:cobaltochelatase CobN